MAGCMLTSYLLVGILLISSIPSPEAGRRKKDDNADGIIDCLVHFACECGSAAEIEFFRECIDMAGNRTQKWGLNLANDLEVCPGITGKFSVEANKVVEAVCRQDRKYLDPCMTTINDQFKTYFGKLSVSPYPQDQEDNRMVQETVDCLTPAFQRCQDFPGECM